MTDSPHPTRSISRRTVARGAAWALPSIAVAAAAPAMAASDPCGSCVVPMISVCATTMYLGPSPVFPYPLISTVSMASGFIFNVTGCTGLVNVAAVTISQATLSMSDGSTYTTTTGLGLGVGATGTVVTTGALTWSGVALPIGVYAGVGAIGSLPIAPTSVCFTLAYRLTISGTPRDCSQVVCFTPTLLSAALGSIPGTVTLATTWA